MSATYRLDREPLQVLLANAFAVQKCGLDRESLCALIELERFTTPGDFDKDRALQLVADRALKVSNASGVSIALLEGNELVYLAGSGSAAHDVGHHVPAVLSVPPEAETRREILRVENAQTDSRVEADVCRQFGANSLLMLPIYQNGTLAGVMQVLFDSAHAFLDREMRTYRLMVGLLEERILLHTHRVHVQGAVRAVEQIAGDEIELQYQRRENLTPLVFVPDAGEQQRCREAPTTDDDREGHVARKPAPGWRAFVVRKLSALSRGLHAAIWNEVDRSPNLRFRRGEAAVTVAMMLVIAIWSSYDNLPAPASPGLAFSTARGTGQQAPGQPLSMANATKPVSRKSKDTVATDSAFRRVRIGPNEVDDVAEDVIIRHFKTVPARQTLTSQKEVSFGNDVTMRYFAYTPTTVATPQPSSTATATTEHIMPASR